MRKFSKRTLAIGLPLATVGVAGIAFASAFTVNSNTFGSGDASTASCQTGALTVTPTLAYVASDTTYDVTEIAVSGIQSACVDATGSRYLHVTLSGTNGGAAVADELDAELVSTDASLTGSGPYTYTYAPTSGQNNVPASAVDAVHAMITDVG